MVLRWVASRRVGELELRRGNLCPDAFLCERRGGAGGLVHGGRQHRALDLPFPRRDVMVSPPLIYGMGYAGW